MPAPSDLVDLGYGRGMLRAAPAASVFRIDRRLGRPVDINSAYRDWDTQMDAYDKYQAYRRYINGGPWAPWAPLALHPSASWHCQGMAADTDEPHQFRAEDGWRFIVPTERWHGQYYAGYDLHANEPAGGGSQPLPTPTPEPSPIPEGADMIGYWLAQLKGDKNVWIMDPFSHTKRVIGPTEKKAIEAAFLAMIGKPLVVVVYTEAAQLNGYKNV